MGIQLKEFDITDRQIKSGSWNSMVSHRVKMDSEQQVDDELIDWLKENYERAG